jgi:sec-independent protein translocase protein TatC
VFTLARQFLEPQRWLIPPVAAWSIGLVLGYWLHEPLLNWLQWPLSSHDFYSPVASFDDFALQASLFLGCIFATPALAYSVLVTQRARFLGSISRRESSLILAGYSGSMLVSIAAAYVLLLPIALTFLSAIDASRLHPLIASASYLSFVLAYIGAFAVAVQFPLLVFAMNFFAPVSPAALARRRQLVILGTLGAALILPVAPDPVSQFLLALPIIVIYEGTIWGLAYLQRPRRSRQKLAPKPRPAQQRLPMAIAIPHRPRPATRPMPPMPPLPRRFPQPPPPPVPPRTVPAPRANPIEPIRRARPGVIDMREKK